MPLGKLLKGVVEADETFVGGKGEHLPGQVSSFLVTCFLWGNH
jgi:hypothetical protein